MKIWNREYPHIGTALVLIVIVFSTWAIYLYSSFQTMRSAESEGISRLGQFGDAFGAINALFTGLALSGLVYTALLHHEQVQAQRQELQQQAHDSVANRQALSREQRELFLTARLNATVAMLQANEAMMGFTPVDDEYARLQGLRETRKLKQQVSLLLCEARLGFEADWSVAIERRAINDYLTTYFSELIYRCNIHHLDPLSLFQAAVERERLEMGTFCEQIQSRHPSTAAQVIEFMDSLGSVKNREAAAKHIEDFMRGVPNL